MRNHIRKSECKIGSVISSKTGSGHCYTMGFMEFLDIGNEFLDQKLYISFIVSYSLLGRYFIIIKAPAVDGLNIVKLYLSLFYKPIDASVKVEIMILGILSLRSRKHDDRMTVMSGHFYLETDSQYI
jgi:hypothetical protein